MIVETKIIEKITEKGHSGRQADWSTYHIHFTNGEKITLCELLLKIKEESDNWKRGGSFSYEFIYNSSIFYFSFEPICLIDRIETKMKFHVGRWNYWSSVLGLKKEVILTTSDELGEALLTVQDIAHCCGGNISLVKNVFGEKIDMEKR